jgi:hypothetical protein
MPSRVQFRNDSSIRWSSVNPVLLIGEVAIETDTKKIKIGDGVTAWVNLPFIDKGEKGDKGDPGEKGDTGDQGIPGLNGRDGKDGRDGLNGKNGKDGKTGKDGKDGIDGRIPVLGVDYTVHNGIAGKDGNPGEKGDQGEPGEDGHTPIAGIDFIVRHGRDGKDGRNGRDGGGSGGPDDTLLETCTITYNAGLVTRIDYASGQSKVFTYNVDETCKKMVWSRLTDTVTKDYVYNVDGTIASVTVTIV